MNIRNLIYSKVPRLNDNQKNRIIIILLMISFTSWLFSTWSINYSYQQMKMDSFGLFEYVSIWFWISFLICILTHIFYNNLNKITVLIFSFMLGLITIGSLAIILPLGTHNDSFFNLASAFTYFEQGKISVGNNPRTSYPTAYILWGMLQNITSISFNGLLKYHSLILIPFYILSSYLITSYFFDNKNSKTWIYFVFFILVFGSRFGIRLNIAPQTIAFVASIFFLAFYFKKELKFRVLQLILLAFIVLTHAVTSHYLISVLVGLFGAEQILKKVSVKFNSTRLTNNTSQNTLNALLTFIAMHMAWFIYNGGYYFRNFVFILNDYIDIVFIEGSFTSSILPKLYGLSNPPLEMLIANRIGWILLIFIGTTVVIAILMMIKSGCVKKGTYLIMWIAAISVNFLFFSYYTRVGLILDRWFTFMLIPFGLAFAYALNEVMDKFTTTKKNMRMISIVFLVLLIILSFASIYTSRYTDNFNSLTQTEINAYQFNQFIDDYSNKMAFYIGCEQNLNNSVLISNQIINTRTYVESNYNNTLVQLEKKVILSPMHSLVYNNGNVKFYNLN